MKVHLKQIPPQGLHIEGEESADILDLKDENITPVSPVSYSLDVGLSHGGLFATGHLAADVQFECVSCLEPFVYPVRVENFATQIELGGAETVDLTPQIREYILLALPPHPRCDWDGKNVCKGAPRNTTEAATPEGSTSQSD